MLIQLIEFFTNGISPKFLLQCISAISLGGFISVSLIFSGQAWAKTFSNITTFCLLPLIGLVITTVISGNIALSLGMVGALSIIRFRHPVKSPLELSIYFLLLTCGITISTSMGKAIVLCLFSMTVVYSYAYIKRKQILSNKGHLDLSFSREEPQFILEINCSSSNKYLSENNYLLFSNEDYKNANFTYKLSFFSKNDLDITRKYISEFPEIQDIKYSVL
tara:strand:+ start:626 stop:1285 length:660 start_codon:yes stop_codon:yes gene_type:complete